MNEDDNEPFRLSERLSDYAKDTFEFTPQAEPGGARDPAWLRWLKFASLIIIPAVAFGFAFFCEYYMEEYQFAKTHMEEASAERVTGDPLRQMKLRVAIGATIGGGLGMIYVVRCLARNVDP